MSQKLYLTQFGDKSLFCIYLKNSIFSDTLNRLSDINKRSWSSPMLFLTILIDRTGKGGLCYIPSKVLDTGGICLFCICRTQVQGCDALAGAVAHWARDPTPDWSVTQGSVLWLVTEVPPRAGEWHHQDRCDVRAGKAAGPRQYTAAPAQCQHYHQCPHQHRNAAVSGLVSK